MADGATSVLPSSNRGVSENERLPVFVDFLSVSVDLHSALIDAGWRIPWPCTRDDLNNLGEHATAASQALAHHFFGDTVIIDIQERGGRFYKWRRLLHDKSGQMIGMIELGGTDTCRKDGTYTARIELTGEGCRVFEAAQGSPDHAQRWSGLADLLGLCGAQIKRVDLACDDREGRYPITWAIQQYESGAFDKRGQHPKAALHDDMGSCEGKTFYVGRRQSENMLRAYEKGREQGDLESPWMRYEAELKGTNRRELPLEILMHGDAYMKGVYPCLHFIAGMGERMASTSAKAMANAKRAIRNFKRQYGPFAQLILAAGEGCEITVTRLLRGCARPQVPKWFQGPEHLHEFRACVPV